MLFLCSEVDKVLSGLEILSKVFDQQSSPMVSRILQQVSENQNVSNPHDPVPAGVGGERPTFGGLFSFRK